MTRSSERRNDTTSLPWWRFGYVWLVIAGPAAVVVAGIATVVIAVSAPDPLVAKDYYRRGVEINRELAGRAAPTATPEAAGLSPALVPALQARNHAATPAPDPQR